MQFFLKATIDVLLTIGSCDSFSSSKIALTLSREMRYSLILGQFSASLGIDLGVSKLSKRRDVSASHKRASSLPPPLPLFGIAVSSIPSSLSWTPSPFSPHSDIEVTGGKQKEEEEKAT